MYSLIEVPDFANKDIYTFSKEEAKQYFKWFNDIKLNRLLTLEQSVRTVYSDWSLEYNRDSLVLLYDWFLNIISYREITETEVDSIKAQISKTPFFVGIIDIPKKVFTDETVSVCFDIGSYLGDTLITQVTEAKWIQKLSSKKYIDYAQPLIDLQNSKVAFNPRRVIENIARLKLDNSSKLFSFVELFDELTM